MRIGVPTGVINGFDFVAMDIHKSLACEKKRGRARESRQVRRKRRERERRRGGLVSRASLGPRGRCRTEGRETREKGRKMRNSGRKRQGTWNCQFLERKGAEER